MADQHVEQLINEIEKRSTIWNKWSPLYKNRIAVDKEWEAIAAALKENSKYIFFMKIPSRVSKYWFNTQ